MTFHNLRAIFLWLALCVVTFICWLAWHSANHTNGTGETHLWPTGGSDLTPCCNKHPFDLPSKDVLTHDPALVTCSKFKR